MTPPDLDLLAATLTKAQLRYVTTLREPDGRGKWPARNALVAKGLMKGFPSGGATELCLVLRARINAALATDPKPTGAQP